MNMTFNRFKKEASITEEELCREFFNEHCRLIKVKNEKIAVKNLALIIKTTIRLSNEIGFYSMSMRDLSRETGLSMGALYSYFPGKGRLLDMIHHLGGKTVMRVLQTYIEKEESPAEKLETAVRAHLYLSEIMKDMFYFFYMETKNLNKKNRKTPVASELLTERVFIDILKEGVKKGIFKIDDILLTGSVIKAMLQDWYLKRWKYRKRRINVEKYAGFVIRFINKNIIKELK